MYPRAIFDWLCLLGTFNNHIYRFSPWWYVPNLSFRSSSCLFITMESESIHFAGGCSLLLFPSRVFTRVFYRELGLFIMCPKLIKAKGWHQPFALIICSMIYSFGFFLLSTVFSESSPKPKFKSVSTLPHLAFSKSNICFHRLS